MTPETIRNFAIIAVHELEARESDPSVEQYVDAVLSVIDLKTYIRGVEFL